MRRDLNRIRDYDRMAKLFDQRLGLYARQTIEEAIRIGRLSGREAILDACCGTGELLQLLALAQHDGPLVGIDFSQTMLNVAQHRLRSYPNVIIKRSHVEKLDFPNQTFDTIFNTNALHYLDHPAKILSEFRRVLRPHGRLILTDLAANSPLTRAWAHLRRLVRPTYVHIYRIEEVTQLLEGAGYVVVRKMRWRVNFLWSVMLFEAQNPAEPHRVSISR